jgi:uncharacterized repeat protein (TIGR01451 family)
MFHFVDAKPSARIVLCGLVALVWFMGGLTSTSWAQLSRPTLTPVPTPTSGVEPTVTPVPQPTPQPGADSAYTYTGPILHGRVLNLATGEPQSDVKVVFTTGSISVEALSDEDGAYAFDYLGTANGVLNAAPAPGSGLKPVTQDVAVQTKTGVETIVNLGVTSNTADVLPLVPAVEVAPNYISAGESFTVTILVKNTLPTAISGATVTDLLPDRLVPVSIRSSTGNPYFSEKLGVVELGTLDAGSGALVEIVARLTSGGAAASAVQGNISFYYRENAAAQTLNHTRTDGVAPTVLPVTGAGGPFVGLLLALIVILVGWTRRHIRHTSHI